MSMKLFLTTDQKVLLFILKNCKELCSEVYVAKVPGISGCYTQEKTVAKATERIKEAISSCSKDDDIEPLRFVGIQQIQA